MNRILIFLWLFVISGLPMVNAQEGSNLQIVFYNVENFFDCVDDPATDDDDFTPEGRLAWNTYKYSEKRKHIFKVISNMGRWEPPAIIGLSEVENKQVLQDLISKTPLNKYDYSIVHEESPDERGIDVAMIYRSTLFEIWETKSLNVHFPFDTSNRTRDILYVNGMLSGEKVHFYINHWPSRFGGVTASEKYRLYAARILLDHLSEVLSAEPMAKIIILGDFNDEENDRSLQLLTNHDFGDASSIMILQKEYPKKLKGTLKYQGKCYTFDHILVSSACFEDTGKLYLADKKAYVFAEDFMLTEEGRRIGYKPYRTYQGPKYIGGYSDHLPIYIELKLTTN